MIDIRLLPSAARHLGKYLRKMAGAKEICTSCGHPYLPPPNRGDKPYAGLDFRHPFVKEEGGWYRRTVYLTSSGDRVDLSFKPSADFSGQMWISAGGSDIVVSGDGQGFSWKPSEAGR